MSIALWHATNVFLNQILPGIDKSWIWAQESKEGVENILFIYNKSYFLERYKKDTGEIA